MSLSGKGWSGHRILVGKGPFSVLQAIQGGFWTNDGLDGCPAVSGLPGFAHRSFKDLEHQGFIAIRRVSAWLIHRCRWRWGAFFRRGPSDSSGAAPHELHEALLVHFDKADGSPLLADPQDLGINGDPVLFTQGNDHLARGVLLKKGSSGSCVLRVIHRHACGPLLAQGRCGCG